MQNRSIGYWFAARSLVLLLLTVLGASAAVHAAYVQLARSVEPFQVVDPVALSTRGKQSLASAGKRLSNIGKTAELARRSIALQGLNPTALALKSIAEGIKGQYQTSNELLKLSLKASRREPLAHIASIESSAASDDAGSALESYDLALRTSSEAAKILFPILANAIEDNRIRTELTPYFRRKVKWLAPFVYYTITESPNVKFLSDIVMAAKGFGPNDHDGQLANGLINALVEREHFDDAKRHFLMKDPALRPVISSADFSSLNFSKAAGRMGWQLVETSEYGASRNNSSGLDVYATSGVRGVVAQKLLFLSPGSYDLVMNRAMQTGISDEAITLAFHCHSPGTTTKEELPLGKVGEQSRRIRVKINLSCFVQSLSIGVVGADTQNGSQITVSGIILRPVS